mgnify:FL=1
MSTRSLIENLLTDAFSPNFLEVRDVSAAHYGHAGAKEGGESHFEVDIEATAFSKKTRVQSHRLIYGVLKPLLDSSVHAVALNVRSI